MAIGRGHKHHPTHALRKEGSVIRGPQEERPYPPSMAKEYHARHISLTQTNSCVIPPQLLPLSDGEYEVYRGGMQDENRMMMDP